MVVQRKKEKRIGISLSPKRTRDLGIGIAELSTIKNAGRKQVYPEH